MKKLTGSENSRELKKILRGMFPGIKFSVRYRTASMMDAIDVEWMFGPSVKEVKAIADRFQYGTFDGMVDMYSHKEDHDPTLATESGELIKIAGVKYVQTRRGANWEKKDDQMTEDLFKESLQMSLCEKQGVDYTGPDTPLWENDYRGVSDISWKILGKCSFVSDQVQFIELIEKEDYCGSIEDCYKIKYRDLKTGETYITGEKAKEKKVEVEARESEGIKVMTYKNSLLVYGDTFPLKDELKAAGGRWNSRLKNTETGERLKGWIFPTNKAEDVIEQFFGTK